MMPPDPKDSVSDLDDLADLVNQAENQCRGGKFQKRLRRDLEAQPSVRSEVELLDNDFIEELAKQNGRLGAAVEMRVFAAVTIRECIIETGVSSCALRSGWAFARTCLKKGLCR